MADLVTITIDGARVSVPAGTVLAVALFRAGVIRFRRSMKGEPRGPLCGMGICFECCVTVNGRPHCRSCQTLCEEGMDVRTDE
jgi:predicted molibdopterin-dependent oxidoreductase YjgC